MLCQQKSLFCLIVVLCKYCKKKPVKKIKKTEIEFIPAHYTHIYKCIIRKRRWRPLDCMEGKKELLFLLRLNLIFQLKTLAARVCVCAAASLRSFSFYGWFECPQQERTHIRRVISRRQPFHQIRATISRIANRGAPQWSRLLLPRRRRVGHLTVFLKSWRH